VPTGRWLVHHAERADEAEYVTQKFEGLPPTHIRNGGKFNGMMLEGVVAF
jgi:hypothetical protein